MNELKSILIHNKKPLLLITLAAVVICWFLGSSFLNLVHNKMEFNRLSKYSAQLDKDHEALQAQLELLNKQDPAYMQRLARIKYHMSAKGEMEFRFQNK